MRIRKPEKFDTKVEYKPGERVEYKGMILIAESWTKNDARFANENPRLFTQRCARCMIKREDCPGINLQCDKFSRSDRKTIYWRFIRLAKGYTAEKKFRYNYDGEICGVDILPKKTNENE